MGFIFSFIAWFGTAFTWLLKDFAPSILKRFGIGAITGVIQKAVSVIVIGLTVAFFGFTIYFISQVYSAFRNFLDYSSNLGNGGDQWVSCFLNLLHASGIAQGVTMAMPFLMFVLVFYFGYAAYRIVLLVSKTISDETFKTGQSFK